ncbi:hypothetical protein DV736_g4430, partial [Chaetothyriales sp. CBS 134916]
MANRRPSSGQAPRMLMGPPETPSRVIQASPTMFPSLQFSPDIFSPAFGPASAPIYPQQRLFWDPNATAPIDHLNTLPSYQDPMAVTGPNNFSQSFGPASTLVPPFVPGQQMPQQQSYGQAADPRPPTTYVAGPAFPGPFSTSPRMPLAQDDNPSMFLSSPARRFTNDHQPTRTVGSFVQDRPAYYHQIEESRREKEAKRRRKNEVRHPSVTRSVMEALRRPISPVKDSFPGLKRSLTHSGAHGRQSHLGQQSHVSFLDNVSTHSGSTCRSGRTGRSSPLKSLIGSVSRQQVGSKTSKRTSLSLEIDENGVAKTVVTKIPDEIDMDLDMDEEDDSGSESGASSRDESDFGLLASQQNSFCFPNDDEDGCSVSQTPVGRFQGHSKNSSYSTMASHGSTIPSSRNSSTFLSLSNAKLPNRAPAQRKTRGLHTMQEDVDMTPVNGSGDAQQALRAMLQTRSRSTSAHDGSGGSQHSAQFNSSPPVPHHAFSNYNVSPTTITDPGLATPSTDHESPISSGGTRCVCNNPEPSTLMIQCDSCTKWLHSMCVGVHDQRLPDVYVCIYCSQTPVRRGRIGGATRSPMAIAQSPLAHKSGPPRWSLEFV